MQIQDIAHAVKFEDSEGLKQALQKMKSVPEHELQYYLVLRDTLQATSPETRKMIMLAQVESERRVTSRTWWLAIITTLVSGAVGLVGVGLGACLTYVTK